MEDDIVPMDASHASDIERIDEAIEALGQMCDSHLTLDWKSAEPIFDALGDARTSIISLAEKLNEARASKS
jgi:hypothetical protein